MARNDHKPETFETIANDLDEASATLRALTSLMRQHEMPSVLIHGTTAQSIYLPALLEWVGKVNADVRTQLRSYLAGTQSKAELTKQQNERQKLAAAKKPLKKATKRKT